jgi:hypothetical protein
MLPCREAKGNEICHLLRDRLNYKVISLFQVLPLNLHLVVF